MDRNTEVLEFTLDISRDYLANIPPYQRDQIQPLLSEVVPAPYKIVELSNKFLLRMQNEDNPDIFVNLAECPLPENYFWVDGKLNPDLVDESLCIKFLIKSWDYTKAREEYTELVNKMECTNKGTFTIPE